ncbi:nephronectin [Sardina pilchardus]|uniref:nephronectin n=1 Tax=Sardina pilchardus TaxID=27697 RepID=UPI002E14C449
MAIFSVAALYAAALHGERTDTGILNQWKWTQPEGVCVFGRSTGCCHGWRNESGFCQPICVKPCIRGSCVGPDACSCQEGYQGQQCSEDVNECGLPTRPCSHSCMNTIGSYRCYCDPGYSLNMDQTTCTKEPKCWALRCQYGCQSVEGGGHGCLCPPGLSLAADNRTCKDIDECVSSPEVCPVHQTCKNTFGSFVCVCKQGFILGTLDNSITCRDQDECLTGKHHCSRNALCTNTAGSYRCQCREGFSGDGFICLKRRAGQSLSKMYYQFKLSKRTGARHYRL